MDCLEEEFCPVLYECRYPEVHRLLDWCLDLTPLPDTTRRDILDQADSDVSKRVMPIERSSWRIISLSYDMLNRGEEKSLWSSEVVKCSARLPLLLLTTIYIQTPIHMSQASGEKRMPISLCSFVRNRRRSSLVSLLYVPFYLTTTREREWRDFSNKSNKKKKLSLALILFEREREKTVE